MITGDHLLTAKYIADQLGITGEGESISGPELDHLSNDQLKLGPEGQAFTQEFLRSTN